MEPDLTDPMVCLTAALADRYSVERELGAGGMATVYLAHDRKHDRHVALKVLRPDLGAVLGGERFLAEIRTTARLQHPHILPLLDSGEAAGFLYYVMPYVTGETLRTRLARERQLGVDEVVHIVRALAGALDYAHAQGVIHRDLKPENILFQANEPMLADFGIALAVATAGGGRLTEAGLSLGTPQYMSPEQAAGDWTLDARSDVYALGAVTYEMLAGEPPHTGATTPAILMKVMTLAPAPLSVVRAGVPMQVQAAVTCALAKAPGDRPSTAGTFARDLAQSREARVVGLSALAPRWRARAGSWLAAGVLVAAGVATMWPARQGTIVAPVTPRADLEEVRSPADAFHREGQVWLRLRTAEGLHRAMVAFDSAIARDSSFAAAYADLSKAYSLSLVYRYRGAVPAYTAAARALTLANHAIELDPALAAGYEARGYVASRAGGPLDLVRGDFQQAQRMNPKGAEALSWSAIVAGREGRTDEALARASQAITLQPGSPPRHIALAMEALRAGRADQVVVAAREALQLDPRLMLARGLELRGLLLAGRTAECLATPPGPHAALRAACLWSAGRLGEARETVDSLEQGFAGGAFTDSIFADVLRAEDLATYYAWTGDAGAALQWVHRAFAESPLGVELRVLRSPLFARVATDSSFQVGVAAAVEQAWMRVWKEAQAP